MMNVEQQLIDNLVGDLTPVKPLQPIAVRFLLWMVPSVVAIGMLMYFGQEFRPGFVAQLMQPHFLFETAAASLALFTAGYLAYRVSLPGVAVKKWELWMAAVPAALFIFSVVYGLFVESALPPSMVGKRPYCMNEILLYGFIPFVFLLTQMIFAFPVRIKGFVRLTAIASAIIPTAYMQVACMYAPDHVLYFHIGPMLAVIGVGMVLGSFVMRHLR